jgi:hypothetical protein
VTNVSTSPNLNIEFSTNSTRTDHWAKDGIRLCRLSFLLGLVMPKKRERLHSELLSKDEITNLLGFLT